jgi:hypothetical protein
MLLVHYRLYITYALAGFLFNLDQKSNICRDIQKIEGLVRSCIPIPQKIYNKTEASNPWRSREIFSRISCFYRFHRAADFQELLTRRKERRWSIQAKRKDILLKINLL